MNKMTVETPNLNTLCINCMHNKGHCLRCTQCGYDERKYQEHPLYLKPRTILANQYIIGIPLGQGGFGITYLGQDLWLQKKVAIKEYLPATFATRDVLTSTVIPIKKQENTFNTGLQMFINEARNLAKFDHPNIVKVINFFEENNTGYMVMDYLESLSLVDILNQAGGCLSVDKALTIILTICDALTEIHAQHIYHRDISIQNIRILTSGMPILIDFGAARHIVGEHSRTLDLVLKHGYSPLEQYSGKGKIGPWTDIYACGALFYLMITGMLPPAATDRFCEDSLIAPADYGVTISTTLNSAIMQALTIRFEERFQTVQEFKAALQGQAPVKLKPPPSVSLAQTQSRLFNHKQNSLGKIIVVIVICIVFFLVMVGLFFSPFRKEKFFQVNEIEIEQNQVQSLTAQINPLLSQAAQYLAESQLEAAVTTYQEVLVIDPNNQRARKGLQQVASKYMQLVNIQQKSLSNRLSLINKGLTIFPDHQGLLALKKELNNEKLIQQRELEAKQVQQQKIEALFQKAQLQLAALHLTTPTGDNAYETYQKILSMVPNNIQAQAGLIKIADRYEQLAHIKRNDWQKNLDLIDKGLKVVPTHTGLRVLRQTILQKMQQQKIEYSSLPQLIDSSLPRHVDNVVYPNLQEKESQLTHSLPQSQEKPLVDNTVQNLLAIAQQHFKATKYEAAYQTYKNVLLIESNNMQAIMGLQQIAHRYEQLARFQSKQNHLWESLSLINKGLAAYPKHSGLLALQIEVTRRLNEEIPDKTQPSSHIIFTPSF